MSIRSLIIAPLKTPGHNIAATFVPSKPLPPQRILVVDDDGDIRRICSEALIGSGYLVDTAADGEAGWQVLHPARHAPDSYDLLITDNNMPNLSGVELVKKLRAERMMLPVILASGSALINTGWLQLDAVLPKPFSLDQLVQTVKEVLRAANSSRAWNL